MSSISVVMATYNCENTVRRAIDSIINQTFNDWVFVICDDCSRDGTFDILKGYKEKYPDKFKIIRNDVNMKLPFSLNRCLEISDSEFIARMDADDESVPERFEKQIAFLRSHPEYQVVGSSMIRFDEKGDYDIYKAVKNPNRDTLLYEVPYCHATIMMRKTAYDVLAGYVVSKRTERGQDMDMWFRFYALGYEGMNLQDPLYRVCEDRKAIKRRKFKYEIYITQTRLKGFKLLNYPIYKYYLAFQPIVSYFVPRNVKLWLRRKKC